MCVHIVSFESDAMVNNLKIYLKRAFGFFSAYNSVFFSRFDERFFIQPSVSGFYLVVDIIGGHGHRNHLQTQTV